MACASTRYYDDPLYQIEIWVWFLLGTAVTILRLMIRSREVGIISLSTEDFLSLAVWFCFVGKTVALTAVFEYGSNMDYIGEQVFTLSGCQLAKVELGSRMELLAWYTYSGIIWGLKGIVLCTLQRLRLHVNRERLFKVAVTSTIMTYVAMSLTISCGCLPFRRNWQVAPPPPPQCSFRMQALYVSTVLNIATDLITLSIPLPALWAMKVSMLKRIGLILLLGSGVFVMSAAVLRLGFVLIGSTSVILDQWCQRETTVGIIAVSAPILWDGLRSIRRCKRNANLPSAPPMSTKAVTFEGPPPYDRCGILPSVEFTRASLKSDKAATVAVEDATNEEWDTAKSSSGSDAVVADQGAPVESRGAQCPEGQND